MIAWSVQEIRNTIENLFQNSEQREGIEDKILQRNDRSLVHITVQIFKEIKGANLGEMVTPRLVCR